MRTIDDYIEYLVLGSIFLGNTILSVYLLAPDVISTSLVWITSDIARITLLAPLILLLGIIANQVSFGLNRAILHKRLLKKEFLHYKRATLLANKVRRSTQNEKEVSVGDVGDVLSWGRHLIFKIGSDEMNKQVLRIYYAYRIAYGSFFITLIPFLCGLAGFFFEVLPKSTYLIAIIGAGILLLLSFVAARNSATYLWQNISYAIEVIIETDYDKFQSFLSSTIKDEQVAKVVKKRSSAKKL